MTGAGIEPAPSSTEVRWLYYCVITPFLSKHPIFLLHSEISYFQPFIFIKKNITMFDLLLKFNRGSALKKNFGLLTTNHHFHFWFWLFFFVLKNEFGNGWFELSIYSLVQRKNELISLSSPNRKFSFLLFQSLILMVFTFSPFFIFIVLKLSIYRNEYKNFPNWKAKNELLFESLKCIPTLEVPLTTAQTVRQKLPRWERTSHLVVA